MINPFIRNLSKKRIFKTFNIKSIKAFEIRDHFMDEVNCHGKPHTLPINSSS